jgi:hypothetical protein
MPGITPRTFRVDAEEFALKPQGILGMKLLR